MEIYKATLKVFYSLTIHCNFLVEFLLLLMMMIMVVVVMMSVCV